MSQLTMSDGGTVYETHIKPMWQTLSDHISELAGAKQPKLAPGASKRPQAQADKDSLRFFQTYYNQWDDERSRSAMVANVARDDFGFHRAIGFSHHPVAVSMNQLPTAMSKVPPADRQRWASTPDFLRSYKMTLWNDDRQLGSDKTY